MKRIAESADQIYRYVRDNPQRQIRFNTLGEGYYFLDTERVMQRMVGSYLMRPAMDSEINDIHRWLDHDMLQIEEKLGRNWIAIHQPRGLAFKS